MDEVQEFMQSAEKFLREKSAPIEPLYVRVSP
jgi:hypothetical protein